MIDNRNEIEVSMFDPDERIQALAVAARNQACDLVVCLAGDQGGPFLRVVEAAARACPGAALNMTIDGPTVRIAVLDVDQVDWASATAKIVRPSPSPLAEVVPSSSMWRCIGRSLRAWIGGAR